MNETQTKSYKPVSPLDTASSTFTLPNGRTIGYCVYGPNDGTPLIWLHGLANSRLDVLRHVKYTAELRCRLIGIDRPGHGLSSPSLKGTPRSYRDHAADVLALADHLGLSTFRVLGSSGGGPYALACASELPKDRLLATGVAAGLGPMNIGRLGMAWPLYLQWKLGLIFPYLPDGVSRWLGQKFALKIFGPSTEEGLEQFLDQEALKMHPDEVYAIADPVIRPMLIANLLEARRQGDDGFMQDALLLAQPWDFDLANAHGRVHLWYGENDVNTPAGHGRWINERLENSELTVFEGTTHIGVLGLHDLEIIKQLLIEK